MRSIFRPRPAVTEEEFRQAFRWLQREVALTAIAGTVIGAGSGILTAYALALGATNVHIGLLAAIPFISALLQLPTVLLVERYRLRKLIAVTSWLASRLVWFPVALIPLWLPVPSGRAVDVMIGLVAVSYLLIAITNTAWSSWMKDLVPSRILGSYFASRFSLATLAAAISGLVFSFFAERWRSFAPGQPAINGYVIVFSVAAVVSVLDIMATLPVPEPAMVRPSNGARSIARSILEPYGRRQSRTLALFLFFWGLASNLATPFFAVYMLVGLKFALTTVMMLTILSQMVIVVFLKAWGPVVDRFGSKAVLSIAVPLYMAVVLGWVFVGMQGRYFMTIPLLVVLHVLAGIATAGVNLCATTIMMKHAPTEKSTPYLVSFSLAVNTGAGLAPVFGGVLADFFSSRELSLALTWRSPDATLAAPAFILSGFDFVFIIAFVLGLLAVNFLAYVVEEGEVRREVVLDQMMGHAQAVVRGISMAPGMRLVVYYPYVFLKHVPGLGTFLAIALRQAAELLREAVSWPVGVVDMASRPLQSTLRALVTLVPRPAAGRDWRSLASEAVQAAVLAAINHHGEVGRVVRTAVASTLVGQGRTAPNLQDLFWAAGYGACQAAKETGIDLTVAAESAVAGARDYAALGGLDEQSAASGAAQGFLEAAKQLDPSSQDSVRKALLGVGPTERKGGAD